MDLLGLRKQIDEIDNELIPLLLKRMSVSEQIKTLLLSAIKIWERIF